jgi:hypothetical protein
MDHLARRVPVDAAGLASLGGRMSASVNEVRGLKAGAAAHERRITALREEIRIAEAKIGLHKALLAVSHDERLEGEIRQLFEKTELAEIFARDPLQYVNDHAIAFPDGLTLIAADIIDEPPPRLIAYLRYQDLSVEAVCDGEGHVLVRPLPQ